MTFLTSISHALLGPKDLQQLPASTVYNTNAAIMQRNKNIDYDEDDLYSEEEEDFGEDEGHTQEDKDNFATLTPVVRAELDEAGIPATTQQIEDALWHYFWDVGKSVAYLKNSRTPREGQKEGKKEGKAKSKFEQAAEKAGESRSLRSFPCSSGLRS